jgi:hypothetical protein
MKPKRFLDCYATYELSENPFTVQALNPDPMGKRLLVGRDQQIQLVAQRLHKHGKITALDGHVGVGKTSLVNVAAYECFKAFLDGETTQLLIPLNESFQLKKDEDIAGFSTNVFRKVAQTLINQRELIANIDLNGFNSTQIDAWLNSPIISHITSSGGLSGSLGVPGANISAKGNVGETKQLNTSSGYTEQGFEQQVRAWLDQIFSTQGNGGVVCVIDNLELLESATAARRTLEALRDKLFNVNGLRWVFCGANGVLHSLAASPRLGAFLNTPIIEVENITRNFIDPLIRARLREFSPNADLAEVSLPIRIEDLVRLYTIINFNLRDLLHLADEYCEHQFSIGVEVIPDAQKSLRFEKWLEKNSTQSYNTLSSRISPDAWAILDIAMSEVFRGTFGVGDYGSFNSNSRIQITKSTFAKWLRDLIKLGLISKSIDDDVATKDDGFKRDVFTVTAKGAMVHYARILKNESQSLAPVGWLRRVHN